MHIVHTWRCNERASYRWQGKRRWLGNALYTFITLLEICVIVRKKKAMFSFSVRFLNRRQGIDFFMPVCLKIIPQKLYDQVRPISAESFWFRFNFVRTEDSFTCWHINLLIFFPSTDYGKVPVYMPYTLIHFNAYFTCDSKLSLTYILSRSVSIA